MSCCKKEPPKCVRRTKCKLKTIKDECRKPPEKKSCNSCKSIDLVLCLFSTDPSGWGDLTLDIYINNILRYEGITLESMKDEFYFTIKAYDRIKVIFSDDITDDIDRTWVLKYIKSVNVSDIAPFWINPNTSAESSNEFNEQIVCPEQFIAWALIPPL
jgi:hypothetical protein